LCAAVAGQRRAHHSIRVPITREEVHPMIESFLSQVAKYWIECVGFGVTLLRYELAILYELINRTGAREGLRVVANALVSKNTRTTPV
jgi:hypothetical protein